MKDKGTMGCGGQIPLETDRPEAVVAVPSAGRSLTGQIALPFVLLIAGIIVEIVIAGSLVSFFVSASSLGERLAIRALAAANSGVYDAVMRISSNKEFASTPENYQITVSDDTVTISVSRVADGSSGTYAYTVESTATARNRQRKIVAEIIVDQTTGLINLGSISEQAVL